MRRAPRSVSTTDQADAAREYVLLVDDRDDNLLALRAVLEPLGYELLTAKSGSEALRTLLSHDASVIVLDVQMPDMDGFETAALLKSREATRSIPILFLTAVGLSVEHELKGYEAGAFDYVCKPFEPRVLQAKVRAAVRCNAEIRALRRANLTYREAGEALASLSTEPGSAGNGRPGRPSPLHTRRVLELEFDPSVRSPAAARSVVRDVLDVMPEPCADVAVLLVSELLANVVLHARSHACLRVDAGDTMVRVEVEDAGTSLPDPLPPSTEAERGRGLFMVEQLADRCGWNRTSEGKTVWFELSWSPPPG